MAENRFYVYEWYNIDTDEVFYVGKGTGNRYKNTTSRNKYFINYYNKYKCDVRKVKDNLCESEAFALEIQTIKKYKDKGFCKCNLSLGGEGTTFEEGTFEYYFKRIQFLYDCTGVIDLIPNRFDYSSDKLNKMTLDEIKQASNDINNYLDALSTELKLGVNYFQNLTKTEINVKNEEITMIIADFDEDLEELHDDDIFINIACGIRDILYGIKCDFECLNMQRRKHSVKLKSFMLFDDDKSFYINLELHNPKLSFLKLYIRDIVRQVNTFNYSVQEYLIYAILDFSKGGLNEI